MTKDDKDDVIFKKITSDEYRGRMIFVNGESSSSLCLALKKDLPHEMPLRFAHELKYKFISRRCFNMRDSNIFLNKSDKQLFKKSN